MAGPDPAIHVFLKASKTWMPGTRPGMTNVLVWPHGKARSLQPQAPALLAARSAADHHTRLLLLAGKPGRMAVVSATGRLRPVDRVHLVGQLPRAVQRPQLLPHHRHHDRVLRLGRDPLALLRAAA